MTQQEHFNRSVAVLVKAYFEGLLDATECSACACGNLVAAATGRDLKQVGNRIFQFEADGSQTYPRWQRAVWGDADGVEERLEAEAEIAVAGYGVQDFARIEGAFMSTATHKYSPQHGQFLGLMAVVDVLADIHEVDLATAEASKLLFVRA